MVYLVEVVPVDVHVELTHDGGARGRFDVAPLLPAMVIGPAPKDVPWHELAGGDHLIDVLVGSRGLLDQATVGVGTDLDSGSLELGAQLVAVDLAAGLVAAHAPGAVARGLERVTARHPCQHVGGRAHRAGDQHRLARRR